MCEICGRFFCSASCPAYSGDRSNGGKLICICGKCNKKLYVSDLIIRTPLYPLCAECASDEDKLGHVLINIT
ncbi:MAG: hypothetical protein E7653_02580 [Ruminococcaceae bacterium]|nr:hypothetical protein [Oscillospiraceae bacterium]